MQDNVDYQRGLETARADAKQGWARCWLPAQQLAEQAVYSAFGLSDEEQGYAAGLDEAFPGGLGQISSFLDEIHPPGTRLADGEGPQQGGMVDALAPVPHCACCRVEAAPNRHGRQQGSVFVVHRRVEERVKTGPKKLFLARFVYLYTYKVSR